MVSVAELAALGAAACWTGSSLCFGYASRAAGPVGTNQLRLVAAIPVAFAACLWLTGRWWPGDVPDERMLWLAVSGVVGLAIGDLGYFHALARIGPRLAAVVQASWPALALLLAWAFAGEAPDGPQVGGLLLVTGGVVLVLWRSRDGSAWRPDLSRRQRWIGIAGALVAALGQAGGMILSRGAMQPGPDLASGIAPIEAVVVRLVAGTAAVFALALPRREAAAFVAVLRQPAALRLTAVGTVFGPILGIWLSMVATRDAERAGTAAALMSLTPLFLLPLSRVLWGARIDTGAVVGTIAATGGVVLLVWR